MRPKERYCKPECGPFTDYLESGSCMGGTPYCGGWTESHCKKCGWFTTDCGCGCSNECGKISRKARKEREKRAKR